MSRTAARSVAWSLALCLLCAGSYLLLFPLPLTGAETPMPAVSAWLLDHLPRWIHNILTRVLSSVAIFSFLAAMTVALVAGPRALRARLTRRGAALTACGLLLAALYCGGPFLWYGQSRRSLEATQARGRTDMAELGARLESGGMSDAQQEQLWRLYARARYRDEGVQVLIPDGSGRRSQYEPTESDIADRRFYLKMVDELKPPIGHLKGSALWVGLCLAVGLLTPLRWPRNPARAPGATGAKSGTGALAEE